MAHKLATSDDINAFQSTLSMRRATVSRYENGCTVVFQSTLSMRRATVVLRSMVWRLKISIHALHEESDTLPC